MAARTLIMMAAMMAAVLGAQLAAQSANQHANQNTSLGATTNEPATQQQTPIATTKRVIVVSLEDHKLALVEDAKVKKIYTVAVGKPSTPSPVGTFMIARRVANPQYTHNGKIVPPGPNNPVGTRWMGLSIPGYGIHGTNEPRSIGKAASHGCIRMARKDLEELYPMVQVGDTVELIGERNEETAQLFGDGPMPAAQPTSFTAVASAEQVPSAAPQLSITAPPATEQTENSAARPGVPSTVATATLSSLMLAASL